MAHDQNALIVSILCVSLLPRACKAESGMFGQA